MFDDIFDDIFPDSSEQPEEQKNVTGANSGGLNGNSAQAPDQWNTNGSVWSTKDKLWNNHDSKKLWDTKG